MSLINKMLQELDKRHAVDGAGKPGAPVNVKALLQQLRPVKAKRDFGEAFWRAMAVLMIGAVGWIAWLLWQIAPTSVVTDLAFQAKGAVAVPPSATTVNSTVASAEAPPVPSEAPIASVPSGLAPALAEKPAELPSAPAVVPIAKAVEPVKIDMLRLATEITTPIPALARRAKPPASKVEQKGRGISSPDAKTVEGAAVAAAPHTASPMLVKPEVSPAPTKAPAGDGKIEKRSNASNRERADAEFRRATAFINQGRIAEAMESLSSSLSLDPAYEVARQTAVGLQLENRRVDDAQHLLQDGLAINPSQTGFAMLLARIQVERGDLNGGLATLQKHGATADNNSDYLAFSAAILQRLARHKEAADIYQAVLRLQPGSGVWWMGLGISLQALKQPTEAAEAFRRARTAGTLSPELLAFVEQRIKQLQ